MPYDGTGGYTLPGTTFPAVTGDIIEADDYNANLQDVAIALGVALTRDGQATVTGNLPMGGFKLTGVGAATINGDALAFGASVAGLQYEPPGSSAAINQATRNALLLYVKDFGSVEDGVTEDGAALGLALGQAAVLGGCDVVITGALYTNLTIPIPPGVTLRGANSHYGTLGNNLSTPYNTVRAAVYLGTTGGLTVGSGGSIRSLFIKAASLTSFPQTNTSLFQANTAITFLGDDCGVFESLIIGFTKAIYGTGVQRPRIQHCLFDNINNVQIVNCADIGRIYGCHAWPFATIAGVAGGVTRLHRTGVSFLFETLGDWNMLTGCFSYGYARGFKTTSCNSMTYLNCGADGTQALAGSFGFEIDGTANDTALIGCESAGQETGVRINTTAGQHTQLLGHRSWGNTQHGVLIDGGDVSSIGGRIRIVPNAISCTNAASRAMVQGMRFTAISSKVFNWTVSTDLLHILNNDFGDFTGSVAATNIVSPTVASAATVLLPNQGETFFISGSTNFGTLQWGWAGRLVTLIWTGTFLALHSSGTFGAMWLRGAANKAGVPGTTMTLRHTGGQWYEVS